MAMDVREVDGRFVVCGRSAARLKERFPEIELRLRGKSAPVSPEVAAPVLAVNPRSRNVFVDVVRGAELVARAVVAADVEKTSDADMLVVLADGGRSIDDFDDPRLDGSYGRAFTVAIVGDEATCSDAPLGAMVRAFLDEYAAAWRDAALAWMRTTSSARRIDGPIVVGVIDGARIVAHVERGVVHRIDVRGARLASWKREPAELERIATAAGLDVAPTATLVLPGEPPAPLLGDPTIPARSAG